jgi:Mce-associated membrane protein
VTIDDDSKIGDVTAPSDAEPAYRRRISVRLRWIRRCLSWWRPILLTLLVVASTAVAAGLFAVEYRPDQQTDNAAAQQVINAASEGAVALLSYSSDSLSRDFTNAKSRLTDDYLVYYKRFTEQIVAPAAQRGQLTTRARVVRAAVSELHPDSAVVLVFVDQKTSSKDKPAPVQTGTSVRVTLTRVDDSWLIAKFEGA